MTSYNKTSTSYSLIFKFNNGYKYLLNWEVKSEWIEEAKKKLNSELFKVKWGLIQKKLLCSSSNGLKNREWCSRRHMDGTSPITV